MVRRASSNISAIGKFSGPLDFWPSLWTFCARFSDSFGALHYFASFSFERCFDSLNNQDSRTVVRNSILALKWRVLSIFGIPGSKVIPKNKRTLVKLPGFYFCLRPTILLPVSVKQSSIHFLQLLSTEKSE